MPLRRILNLFWYHYRRNNWIVYPRRFFDNYNGVEIGRPIFFVGNQGGGLTLISRMLRRHPSIVSITGNHRYWAGADEMQRVMVTRLPRELRLSGKIVGSDPDHPQFSLPRSWSYASDDLVDEYHLTEQNYTTEAEEQFRFLIREALYRYGSAQGNSRFIDKSQVFTLKIRYVDSLLDGTSPHFVLITRNPYAACYRAACGKAGDMERYAQFMTLDERVEICAQHWSNAISRALEDGQHIAHFKVMRFEDFISCPEESLRDICAFTGLEFVDDLVPAPHHEVPFGSRFNGRWYPLRKGVNYGYLKEISSRHTDIIASRCAAIAHRFGYERP